MQSASRALWEEVKFDSQSVTSIDWQSYPILDMTEAPETIDIVLIDHPELHADRRRRRRHAPDRRRDRQRDLRCDWHQTAAGAVHAGKAEGRDGIGSLIPRRRTAWRPRRGSPAIRQRQR